MRKATITLLILCCLSLMVSCGGTSKKNEPEEIVDGYLTYILREDGTYAVKATDVTQLPESVTIPSTFNGIPVTALTTYAFANSNCLKKITIPDSITTLPMGALYQCTVLTEVNLPSTLTGIGKGAVGLCWEHVTIYYDGTQSQWRRKLSKASNWAVETDHTIICTDGIVS